MFKLPCDGLCVAMWFVANFSEMSPCLWKDRLPVATPVGVAGTVMRPSLYVTPDKLAGEVGFTQAVGHGGAAGLRREA